MDFSKLKKSSGSNLEKMAKAVEQMAGGNANNDTDQHWKCELDKSGNGYAIVRFLPTSPKDAEADGLPWIKFYDQ